MKIKEFIKRVNETLYAMYDPSVKAIKVYESRQTYNDEDPDYDYSFMTLFPDKDDLAFGFNSDDIVLGDISFRNLAILFGLVQQLRDTPIKERFPEKKYVLSAMRCVEGPVPVKQYVDAMNISTNNVELHFGFANEKANAMEFTQEDLDSLSGFFPKAAIDAMKEPMEDKND